MTTQFFPCTPEQFPDDDRLDIADIIAVATNELTNSHAFAPAHADSTDEL